MCQPLPHFKPTSGQIQRDVLLPAVIPTCQHKHKVRNEVSRWRYSLSVGGSSVCKVSLGMRSSRVVSGNLPHLASDCSVTGGLGCCWPPSLQEPHWMHWMDRAHDTIARIYIPSPPRASSSSLRCNVGLPLQATRGERYCKFWYRSDTK